LDNSIGYFPIGAISTISLVFQGKLAIWHLSDNAFCFTSAMNLLPPSFPSKSTG
jgi:hypothetical protein